MKFELVAASSLRKGDRVMLDDGKVWTVTLTDTVDCSKDQLRVRFRERSPIVVGCHWEENWRLVERRNPDGAPGQSDESLEDSATIPGMSESPAGLTVVLNSRELQPPMPGLRPVVLVNFPIERKLVCSAAEAAEILGADEEALAWALWIFSRWPPPNGVWLIPHPDAESL